MEIPQRAVMFCQLGFQSRPSGAGNLSIPGSFHDLFFLAIPVIWNIPLFPNTYFCRS